MLATIIKNKHMKIIVLLLIGSFAIIGCNSQKQYLIKGNVQGRDSGSVRLSQYGASRMDSKICKLVNGEFLFEGSIDAPEQFILIYEESGPQNTFEAFSIFIEPDANVNIVIYADSISKSKIEGSKLADEFVQIDKAIEKQFSFSTIVDEYNKALQSKDTILLQIISHKGDSIQNELNKWKLNYLEANRKSFISAYLLHSIYLQINPDTVRKYCKMLDKSLNESKYIKDIESFLSVQVGSPFHDFELSDGEGNVYQLSSLSKNKVILIDFWASWCKPCREQNSELSDLYENYKKRGFEIIGISIDRDTTDFFNTIAEDKMTWINLIDRIDETSVYRFYRTMSLPSNVLINRHGIITDKDIAIDNLEHKIDSLLSI